LTRYIRFFHNSKDNGKMDMTRFHVSNLYVQRTPKVAGTNAEAVAAVRTIAARTFMVRFVL
jgi:hypothetical protein